MTVYVVCPVWGGVGSEPLVLTSRAAAEHWATDLARVNDFNEDDELKVFECVVDDENDEGEMRAANPPCVWDAETDYIRSEV